MSDPQRNKMKKGYQRTRRGYHNRPGSKSKASGGEKRATGGSGYGGSKKAEDTTAHVSRRVWAIHIVYLGSLLRRYSQLRGEIEELKRRVEK